MESCQQMDPGLPDITEETEAPELDYTENPFTEQYIRSNAGGGLCLCAFTVGKQWCDTRTGTDACLPSDNVTAVDRESMVPRWRLAREGPFLEERSAESIHSLGPGCAFRNTECRTMPSRRESMTFY